MATKRHDLAVKVSEYTDQQGQVKGRWVNIGAVFDGQDGKPFITINRHFNPAGALFKPGSDAIMVSCFEPKDGAGQPTQQQQRPAQAPAQHRQPGASSIPDDDIPF